MINRSKKATPFCSFCSKPPKQVSALVAGPHVYICDQCVGLCFANLPLRSRLNALLTMFSPWKCLHFRRVKSHSG